MGKTYKVWIEVEESDGKSEPRSGGDIGVLPDCIGVFSGKGAKANALAHIAAIVEAHGIDPENSDSVRDTERIRFNRMVKGVFKRCGSALRRNGRCKDATCPYSDRDQDAKFTEG